MNETLRIILSVIGAIMLGLAIGFVAVANATELRLENCEPNTWVGGVQWEWKDGIRGNYSGSTYKDMPELEIKGLGSVTADVEPGDYAITHYRPRQLATSPSGEIVMMPAKIMDFVEIEVGNEPQTLYFGCEE